MQKKLREIVKQKREEEKRVMVKYKELSTEQKWKEVWKKGKERENYGLGSERREGIKLCFWNM